VLQLALTAASPLWRGYIADVDCRWNVIAGSVDDRTEEERGLKVYCGDVRPQGQLLMVPQPLKDSRFVIPKSRYGSVNSYISEDPRNRPEYNDNPFPHDKGVYERLKTHGSLCHIQASHKYTNRVSGLPDLLAKHFAHLFIRDPLVVFSETIDQDDAKSTDHFEVRRPACNEYLGTNMPSTEYPVNELANIEVQTTSTGFQHRVES